jgi:Na+-transporting NADH:ubiquinone oxidoreductase subunit NqrB
MKGLRAIDPRWFVLGNNLLLLFFGLVFFGLQRSGVQIVTCFAATIGAELLAARLAPSGASSKRKASIADRCLSAATAAASTLILLVSPAQWFYALVGAIAIASKYLVRGPAGKHVFNPTNFAIVFSVALLPDRLLVRPDQFSGSPWLLAQIFVFGVLAATRGARFRTTLGYYLVVFGFALPVGMLLGVKPLWILAPEMNTSTLIFACLMITDPQTTPASPAASGQWAFGAAVGIVHVCLRYIQVPYSPFIALFVVAGVRSCLVRAPVDAPALATR